MKKVVLILMAFSLSACAMGSDDAVKKSISNINEELVVIQKSITDNQMATEDVKASSSASRSDITANTDAIAELRSEIAYLNNEIMLLKSKGGVVPGAKPVMGMDNLTATEVEGEDNVSENPTVITDDTIADDDQQIIIIEDSSAAKNSIYSYAIELNRQRKYSEARAKFEEFLQKYPKDELAGNAQYWIGETYYSVDELPQALVAFNDVLKKYPKSNKVPDAMLKVGYVLDKQGDRKGATEMLQGLVKRYSKSKPAALASQRLKSWGVK